MLLFGKLRPDDLSYKDMLMAESCRMHGHLKKFEASKVISFEFVQVLKVPVVVMNCLHFSVLLRPFYCTRRDATQYSLYNTVIKLDCLPLILNFMCDFSCVKGGKCVSESAMAAERRPIYMSVQTSYWKSSIRVGCHRGQISIRYFRYYYCHPSSSIFSCSGQSRTLELICYITGPFSFSTYLFREKYVKTKHTINARKHYKRLSSHMYQNFSLTEAQTFNKLYFLANSVCTVDCRLVSFRSTIVIN